MFASGFFTNSPRVAKASSTFWSSFNLSGNRARILAAKEMSLVSMSILEFFTNAFAIGKKE